ncbi:hypothetical protein I3842_13G090300 [Carya illinoinensis]|uniref:Cyclin-dependent protein kinase inhibitor SMR4 n=1 Tax=Carya illinoinensis TaxID=32201 RepID=A0A922DC06_CARIL|nr:hypothetical protein I3842_13G090300 [Carya illinoinensis]
MEERDQEVCCEAGCSTPRRLECRIPVAMVPPPPPKKKKPLSLGKKKNEKREPSKNGYFQPPDIELFFAMAPRRHACAL